MRRIALLALLFVPALGCASIEKSYRDFAPETPAALTASAPSPEVDALVARFYGPEGVDRRTIDAAFARAPQSSALHEIAGYDAIVRADKHVAFEHFLAAAADQGAISPELYLWEMRSLARTTSERMRAQALLRELKDHHPRAAVRQLAAYDLARELVRVGEYEEATELVGALGFADAWQVLGSFDNEQGKGFETAYEPESGPALDKTYAGVRLPIRFRPVAVNKLDGALPLADVLWPNGAAVAYAETFVFASRARQVDLRITTTNAVRVWLGDRLVASDDKVYHDELDNLVVRVALPAGTTRLLIKSAHEGGAFRLAARITEIDGTVPNDVRYAATAAAQPAAVTGQLVSPLGAIDKLEDKNRKRFLEARLWAREGHSRRAAWYLSPLVLASKDNPAAMLFGAVALIDNGESGKALDLLNRGVERFPEGAGFLMERARFHMARRQWDRAEKDLAAALAKQPVAEEARLLLASAYGAHGWTIDRCLELQAVVEPGPDPDALAMVELARCKLERGYAEEAERLLRRARALAPGDARVLLLLVEIAERRVDHAAAQGYLQELAAARPGGVDVALEQAEIFRRQGKLAEAEASLQAATARSPDAPRAYDRLAQLAYEKRKRADAERWWRLALEREPEDAAIAQRLAALAPDALPLGDRLAPTADEIDRAVRSAPGVKVHPGSHTVLLLDDEVTTINADGSTKRIVTQVAQAVTTDGRDALIQAHLPPGRVNVIEAYAIRRNGERQDASSMLGGIVRFRGLEVGSITVVQYAHFAPSPRFLPNEYAGEWRFSAVNAQIRAARWRVVLPKDRTLNVETRGSIERRVEVVGAQKVWTFTAKDAPPLVPEPNMPPAADELWFAAVSTLASWDGYARWESTLVAQAFQPGPELDALAAKLTAGATTAKDKLERLWAYVAQEIRYQQEYEDSIAGIKPHAAGVVLERGYGDCKDKAVLMMRLARAVGVELRFALLRTVNVGKVKKDLPTQQFNHAIVYAPKQPGVDEAFFIDTTTNGLDIGNMRSDDEGATSLVLDKDGRWEFIPIPYQSPDLEFVRHDVRVTLADPQKASARDHVEARGAVAAGMRIALRSGEGARKFESGLADQLFPGTTLTSGKFEHAQDLTRPVSLHLEVDASNAVKSEDDRLRFEVPMLFPIAHAAALASREHPLRLWRGTQEIAMDVDLGDKQKPLHAPADFSVEHPCFTVSRKTETKGTHVVVHARYRNTCAEVAPADYPAFRAAVQKAVAKMHDAIVFSGPKPGTKPAR